LIEGFAAFLARERAAARGVQVVRHQNRGRFRQPVDSGFMTGVVERNDQDTVPDRRRRTAQRRQAAATLRRSPP
jgi:hypothetical protein